MQPAFSPEPRLQACGELVREGAILLDVGSDHALLPITLWQTGRLRGAVATDLNEGPILRAKTNLAAAGLEGHIRTVRRDGLSGAEKDIPLATDVVIAGMGGELIAAILAAADPEFWKDPARRFILQPMTRQAALRRYLWDAGFAVTEERLVHRKGALYYQILAAHYAPAERGVPYSPLEAAYGRILLARREEATLRLLEGEAARLRRVQAAKANRQHPEENEDVAEGVLLAQIEDYLRLFEERSGGSII